MPTRPLIYVTSIELKGAAAYGLRRREFNNVKKAAYLHAGEHYRDAIIARHFGNAAARRYGYQRRTKDYEEYKEKRWGHKRPLEFSGVSKDRALDRVRLVPTVNKLTIRINSPGFNRRANVNAPYMRDELQRLVNEDIGEMNQAFMQGFRRTLRNTSRTKRVRYRLRPGG